MATCGAKTRSGEPCKLVAGHGTDHKGTGRCKFHGGATPDRVKFKPGHKESEKHGLYARHLPEDSLDLLEMDISPLDMMWDSIMIHWAGILRSQKIMNVESAEDHARLLKAKTEGAVTSETWEVEFAHERQASFIKVQSTAIGALVRGIKQYEEMLQSDLAVEEQKLKIEKLKTEIRLLTGLGDELEDLSDVLEEIYG